MSRIFLPKTTAHATSASTPRRDPQRAAFRLTREDRNGRETLLYSLAPTPSLTLTRALFLLLGLVSAAYLIAEAGGYRGAEVIERESTDAIIGSDY